MRHILFYIVSAVISLILIFYICYHLFGGFTSGIETVPATLVTRQEAMTLDGYLFRDERVLYSGTYGDVNYLYDDGEKVPMGEKLAEIHSNGNPDLRTRIIAIDRQIALLEGSNLTSSALSDTTVIDNRIWQLYYLMRSHIESGDVEYAMHKKDEYLTLLNKRRIVTQTVKNYDDKISALKAERLGLTSSLTSVSAVLTAPVPGYFYATLDGCEDIFTAAALETLTVERFDQLIAAEPVSTDARTADGYPVGKLVTNYVWHLACEVDGEQLREFSQNGNYSLMFPYNGDMVLKMKLIRILPDTMNERAVLLFETNVMPENFNYLRVQTVRVVREEHSGYRVPLSAVRVVDGQQGVYIRVGNYVRFRRIETLFESDGILLVRPFDPEREDAVSYLNEKDEIITKGKNLYDGKVVT